ncbi:hypothetical protein CARN8_4060031 [mine drainage metagenome]|uniref:Uncharacterized protein n=1 Tax=mine drainage metagenome TaxID=410659 RepID=A0A3P3ZQ82_9ZZZZ
MAYLRLGHATGTPFTVSHLNSRIPIRCWRFDLCDAITAHFHDGDWNSLTVISEDARHADFTADKSYRHLDCSLCLFPVRTPWPSSGADSN